MWALAWFVVSTFNYYNNKFPKLRPQLTREMFQLREVFSRPSYIHVMEAWEGKVSLGHYMEILYWVNANNKAENYETQSLTWIETRIVESESTWLLFDCWLGLPQHMLQRLPSSSQSWIRFWISEFSRAANCAWVWAPVVNHWVPAMAGFVEQEPDKPSPRMYALASSRERKRFWEKVSWAAGSQSNRKGTAETVETWLKGIRTSR